MTKLTSLSSFVNEKLDSAAIVNAFAANLLSKKLIENKKDLTLIYDESDATQVSEVRIPFTKISIEKAEEVIEFANKYPAFKGNIDNALVDGDAKAVRLLFVTESYRPPKNHKKPKTMKDLLSILEYEYGRENGNVWTHEEHYDAIHFPKGRQMEEGKKFLDSLGVKYDHDAFYSLLRPEFTNESFVNESFGKGIIAELLRSKDKTTQTVIKGLFNWFKLDLSRAHTYFEDAKNDYSSVFFGSKPYKPPYNYSSSDEVERIKGSERYFYLFSLDGTLVGKVDSVLNNKDEQKATSMSNVVAHDSPTKIKNLQKFLDKMRELNAEMTKFDLRMTISEAEVRVDKLDYNALVDKFVNEALGKDSFTPKDAKEFIKLTNDKDKINFLKKIFVSGKIYGEDFYPGLSEDMSKANDILNDLIERKLIRVASKTDYIYKFVNESKTHKSLLAFVNEAKKGSGKAKYYDGSKEFEVNVIDHNEKEHLIYIPKTGERFWVSKDKIEFINESNRYEGLSDKEFKLLKSFERELTARYKVSDEAVRAGIKRWFEENAKRKHSFSWNERDVRALVNDFIKKNGDISIDVVLAIIDKFDAGRLNESFVNEAKLSTTKIRWSETKVGDIISADGPSAEDELSEVVVNKDNKKVLKIVRTSKYSRREIGDIIDNDLPPNSAIVYKVTNFVNEAKVNEAKGDNYIIYFDKYQFEVYKDDDENVVRLGFFTEALGTNVWFGASKDLSGRNVLLYDKSIYGQSENWSLDKKEIAQIKAAGLTINKTYSSIDEIVKILLSHGGSYSINESNSHKSLLTFVNESVKHKDIIDRVKSKLSKEEFEKISRISNVTSSGYKSLGLYFEDENTMNEIAKKLNIDPKSISNSIQKRYGIGFSIGESFVNEAKLHKIETGDAFIFDDDGDAITARVKKIEGSKVTYATSFRGQEFTNTFTLGDKFHKSIEHVESKVNESKTDNKILRDSIGKKVLLIDTDSKQPQEYHVFGVSNNIVSAAPANGKKEAIPTDEFLRRFDSINESRNSLSALSGNVIGMLRVYHNIKDRKALSSLESSIDSNLKTIENSGGVSARVHKFINVAAENLGIDAKTLEDLINDEIEQLNESKVNESKVNESVKEDLLKAAKANYEELSTQLSDGKKVNMTEYKNAKALHAQLLADYSEIYGDKKASKYIVESKINESKDKSYAKDVEKYEFFIVDLANKKAVSGWEFKDDAKDALSDYDGDKNFVILSETQLKSKGIENPKAKWINECFEPAKKDNIIYEQLLKEAKVYEGKTLGLAAKQIKDSIFKSLMDVGSKLGKTKEDVMSALAGSVVNEAKVYTAKKGLTLNTDKLISVGDKVEDYGSYVKIISGKFKGKEIDLDEEEKREYFGAVNESDTQLGVGNVTLGGVDDDTKGSSDRPEKVNESNSNKFEVGDSVKILRNPFGAKIQSGKIKKLIDEKHADVEVSGNSVFAKFPIKYLKFISSSINESHSHKSLLAFVNENKQTNKQQFDEVVSLFSFLLSHANLIHTIHVTTNNKQIHDYSIHQDLSEHADAIAEMYQGATELKLENLTITQLNKPDSDDIEAVKALYDEIYNRLDTSALILADFKDILAYIDGLKTIISSAKYQLTLK